MNKNSTKPQNEITLRDKEGQLIDIPVGGSLSLLAWGDLGHYAWRQKRAKLKKTNDEE